MPGYKAHLYGTAFITLLLLGALFWFNLYVTNLLMSLFLLGIATLGGLFPDVDTDSKGQNIFYGAMVIIGLVLILKKEYQAASILGCCAMLPAVGHHRGWTHTLWAMIVVPMPIIILPIIFYHFPWKALVPFYLAAVFGYFSHLLLDGAFKF